MSPKTLLLAAGMTAAGISWAATRCDARPETPQAPSPAPSESPSGPPTVILLSSGKILRGELSEGETGYVLKQKLGPIPLAKRDVEKTFHSLREVYEYKRDRLAQGDPDEHMTLARWCIAQGLKDEAREQLSAILALVDDHPTATSMLAKLKVDADRVARADPDVVRTSLEGPGAAGGKPEEIDPAFLKGGKAKAAALGRPVIFDLPPALAARRFQEFNAYIHPELQRHCAGCHNEHSESKFQLLQAKTPRAMADGLLRRTNLDAALKFVDPENPPRSDLLINAAMPHGGAKQAVYSGPNQPGYRTLAAWVNALRSAPTTTAVAGPAPRPGAAANSPPQAGGFAAERGASPPDAARNPASVISMPPLPNFEAVHPSVPADADFRTISPVAGSGPNAAPIGARPKPQAARALPPGVPPEALKPLTAADLEKLDRKAKPKAIDPNLLQKVMEKRSATP